tara:strand:- start:37 stop:231 length:195 start_codon:yes stop_codon:yes gene_type:complete
MTDKAGMTTKEIIKELKHWIDLGNDLNESKLKTCNELGIDYMKVQSIVNTTTIGLYCLSIQATR